eukprot:1434000-Rhodomonas_salina.3
MCIRDSTEYLRKEFMELRREDANESPPEWRDTRGGRSRSRLEIEIREEHDDSRPTDLGDWY